MTWNLEENFQTIEGEGADGDSEGGLGGGDDSGKDNVDGDEDDDVGTIGDDDLSTDDGLIEDNY